MAIADLRSNQSPKDLATMLAACKYCVISQQVTAIAIKNIQVIYPLP
jgi:hypothetical protein